MTGEPLRHDVCDMCGETADLFINDDVLPEEFEGVACGSCIEYHTAEKTAADEMDYARHRDRQDIINDDMWEDMM